MTNNILEVDKLKLSFFVDDKELRAVNGVSFNVRKGKTLAIVGESGCGKSVTSYALLKLVAKPGRITGGSIKLHPGTEKEVRIEKIPDDDPQLLDIRGNNISMIFQEPMTALSPVYTIGNQIAEAILLHQNKTKEEARKITIEMLRKVGIPGPEKRVDQYPHELSGGMRQRAVIAMALVCRPDIIIADEPTTALDVTIQAQILELMKDLQQETGAAISLVTHDLGVVAQTADDVAVMYLGRIVEKGDVLTVLTDPKHPYTKGLLQSIPTKGKLGQTLYQIEGSVPPLHAVPEGCAFHPRCPLYVKGLCDKGEPPPLINTGKQEAACLLLKDNPGGTK